jgi:hypothetical protein
VGWVMPFERQDLSYFAIKAKEGQTPESAF